MNISKNFEDRLNLALLKSAPLMPRISKEKCQGSYVSKKNCSWYHGVWQYLRMCDKVSSPTWHLNFFGSVLKKSTTKYSKILISSCADYSMLAVVIDVAKSLRARNEITVADVCETPLYICRWYSKKVKFPIKTIKKDIRKLNNRGKFDVIVTDAFLTRFDKRGRNVVVKKLYDLLEKDGYVATTVRLGRNSNRKPIKASKYEINKFSREIERCLSNKLKLGKNYVEKIKDLSVQYGKNMISFPISSASEVRSLFEKNKFKIEKIEVVKVRGEFGPTRYCRVFARK